MNTESPGQNEQLGAGDVENLKLAKEAYEEYFAEFTMANNEAMSRAEASFREAVTKLSPNGKKALDNYFNSMPKSERPKNIALEY